MVKLVQNLLVKFVKSKLLYTREADGTKSFKSFGDLLSVDLNQRSCWKPLSLIDVGIKAKCCFGESLVMSDEEQTFGQNCLAFFVKSTEHLKTKLPLHSNVLKNAMFLDPVKHNDTGSLSAISNLVMDVCKPLASSLGSVFQCCHTVDDVVDNIRNEFRMLQMDTIPDLFMTPDPLIQKGRKQDSYWELAFEKAGISTENEHLQQMLCLDTFINSMSKMKESGKPKYPLLVALYKLVGSLSHGNSAPEN